MMPHASDPTQGLLPSDVVHDRDDALTTEVGGRVDREWLRLSTSEHIIEKLGAATRLS